MINLSKLKKKHIGEWVLYSKDGVSKRGRIKSWNDKYLFVVYNCDNDWDNFMFYTAEATNPKDII